MRIGKLANFSIFNSCRQKNPKLQVAKFPGSVLKLSNERFANLWWNTYVFFATTELVKEIIEPGFLIALEKDKPSFTELYFAVVIFWFAD